MEAGACIILTSVESQRDANRIAEALVEKRLAACVQISAAGTSIYRWQGDIRHEPEHYLSIKTTARQAAAAVDWLKRNHPYEVPEIIMLDGEAGIEYMQWMRATAE